MTSARWPACNELSDRGPVAVPVGHRVHDFAATLNERFWFYAMNAGVAGEPESSRLVTATCEGRSVAAASRADRPF